MHFYKKQGKQFLNMQGDLILTHNLDVVSAFPKSAGPTNVSNVRFIPNVKALSFFDKLKAVFIVARFVFGKDRALPLENIKTRENS